MSDLPDLDKLEQLAIFAIHGDATEWYTEEGLRELFGSGVYPSPSPDTDARFVAAASPEAFLALIERAKQAEAQRDELRRELEHLVFLMEPVEYGGGLNIPGLATLNGARNALAASAPVVEAEEETR